MCSKWKYAMKSNVVFWVAALAYSNDQFTFAVWCPSCVSQSDCNNKLAFHRILATCRPVTLAHNKSFSQQLSDRAIAPGSSWLCVCVCEGRDSKILPSYASITTTAPPPQGLPLTGRQLTNIKKKLQKNKKNPASHYYFIPTFIFW